MDLATRIERGLEETFRVGLAASAPQRLQSAMHHAVFPAGGRIRAQLCLRVAVACGDEHPALSDAAAVAVELLHCASLVHDDLPCFDDAPTRRGRPSVQHEFGEPLAVLAGDALIVLAFETLARAADASPERVAPLVLAVGHGVNAAKGSIAGQAMESEASQLREAYHRAKTAALFEAAVQAGVLAAGGDPAAWEGLGMRLGEAYQLADDIADVLSDGPTLGKPLGQDEILGRPNAAAELGADSAIERLVELLQQAIAAIPQTPQRTGLAEWMTRSIQRLLPESRKRDVSTALQIAATI